VQEEYDLLLYTKGNTHAAALALPPVDRHSEAVATFGFLLHAATQFPHLLSSSTFGVVEHQGLFPLSTFVQDEYVFPLYTKGNTHDAPLALPPSDKHAVVVFVMGALHPLTSTGV